MWTRVSKEAPSTNPAFYYCKEIIVRKNKQKLDKRLSEINVHLKEFCLQKSIGLIDNKNINESCLRKNKLHLSNKGKVVFPKNLVGYIDRVYWDVFPYDSNVHDGECLSETQILM